MFGERHNAGAVHYEIRVAGRINPERAEWFGDMAMAVEHTPEGVTLTVLTGWIRDQAALFGILNRIRDLGLKLISVTTTEPPLSTGAHTHSN